ncbi:MAG: type IV toxin-antitoxin system AbiEi family antitoxin domain-containing protein [Arhodomonas sp.]|nr:type IV toxin-antitoxin system AbiEi family antitoxin domain-containing protein [Arhodomonas sp.]
MELPLLISTPERALLECLDELPQEESFHDVDVLVEGLVDLSPRRMQRLLEQAHSIKVKRLFFFFAERHSHRWLAHIAMDRIDLGKGKRMLVKGGKLDPKYQITVPAELLDAVP